MPADLMLTGGTIRTGDAARPTASAVAVTAGVVTGLDGDAHADRGPGTTVVDLAGGALLPSFGDGHVHPMWGGLELGQAPIRDCVSVAEVVEAVGAFAARPPGRAVGPRWLVRPVDGTGRAVRRPLAGRRGPGPAGVPGVQRPPLRVGELRGAAAGRPGRDHPRPAGRVAAEAGGRRAAGHPRRVDGDGAGPAVPAGADRRGQGRRRGRLDGDAGRGRRHLGAGGGARCAGRAGVPDRGRAGAALHPGEHRAAGRTRPVARAGGGLRGGPAVRVRALPT